MRPVACRYAIVQFVPYTETGEFVNVGVVLACPETGYFDFQLQTRRYGRITGFFHELHRDVYLTAIKTIQMELERIQRLVIALPADEKCKDVIRHLLDALTHPREAIIRFGSVRPVLAANPAAHLTQLFDHYVDRAFATPEYVEHTITKRIQMLLADLVLPAPFRNERIGDDQIYANFPLVQRVDGQLTKVIKPLNLTQAEPNRMFEHGALWLDKVKRLRKRKLLPQEVLFAMATPPEADVKRYTAYREICLELEEEGVRWASKNQENQILAFAMA
jgi:hypothetical protein